jgi:hypothetical protein
MLITLSDNPKDWTISRKPNCISNAKVGSSETTREDLFICIKL